ncbi:unnamed protein product [Acanthoscelides obtectus]|uniref:DDE-1 domain-containing protein n=1 Tax=Acanthoscelides obtectus TaxID=200917 RepID=A0A9P0PHF6_ACAOB|nr:unnamed protein product [Acanthoscelides obtectus]CAK1654568.1 hypothetical protein AOBTE_LOCUS18681 [Acanthoscelides obtectus]
MNVQLMKGTPPGSISAVHPSGWVQASLFAQWFEHFINTVKPTASSPVLLILDGHYSHTRNLEVVIMARENHVCIISLPPHSTHKLQPLDKTFMGTLKSYYSEEIRQWIRHNHRPLTQYDMGELLGRAYLKSQTGEIAVKGFRVTGIEKGTEHCTAENDFDQSTLGTYQSDLEPPSLDNVQPGPSGKFQSDVELLNHDSVQPGPSGIKKKWGRKASQAAVITSSPYKDELLLSTANKNKQKIKSIKKKVFSQSTKKRSSISSKENKKQQSLGESESDDDETELMLADDDLDLDDLPGQKEPDDLDAECIFCESKFSEDRKGELWVQCLMCNMWCHVDCAGADKDASVFSKFCS